MAAIGITLAVVLGGAGVASAANGGNFILGHNNAETARSNLSNSRRTPLMLNAAPGNAPLKVNNTKQVPDLNASEVRGYNSGELAFGGDDYTTPQTDYTIDKSGEVVASTGQLRGGDYYVTGTAMIYVASGDGHGGCYITQGFDRDRRIRRRSAATARQHDHGGRDHRGIGVEGGLHGGGVLHRRLYRNSYLWNSGLTAIRVLSCSGTQPATHGHSVAAMRRALAAASK